MHEVVAAASRTRAEVTVEQDESRSALEPDERPAFGRAAEVGVDRLDPCGVGRVHRAHVHADELVAVRG